MDVGGQSSPPVTGTDLILMGGGPEGSAGVVAGSAGSGIAGVCEGEGVVDSWSVIDVLSLLPVESESDFTLTRIAPTISATISVKMASIRK